jgi:tRNA threonylcarbamoyladenosine biosynthesis protein TsaB
MTGRETVPTTILAIDTATTRVVVAAGTLDGATLETSEWAAGYRHGETLLQAIESLLVGLHVAREQLAAIVVGTGPGAFTGLRVGLATAKGLAHALGRPLIGISTAEALLGAAPAGSVLLLPAGPSDRILVRPGAPARLLPAGQEPDLAAGETAIAVDLAVRAPAGAVEAGEAVRTRLGASLIALGAARLAAGEHDDLARLVPEYVTAPRGVLVESGEVSWSRDLR